MSDIAAAGAGGRCTNNLAMGAVRGLGWVCRQNLSMSKKIDRALYGPSWVEVFFGALLSIILGIVLASVYLIAKPVAVVKELPAEIVPGLVYHIEGSRDSTKGRQWKVKHQQFIAGHSVAVTEEELNAAVSALTSPAANAPAPGKKPDHAAKKAEETPSQAIAGAIVPGVPNFRIRENEMQIAVPVALNALSLQLDVLVQARGGFEKQGDHFVFEPNTLLIGSLPVHRIPALSGFMMGKFFAAQSVPEDIAGAWAKLNHASIEGTQLKLDMP